MSEQRAVVDLYRFEIGVFDFLQHLGFVKSEPIVTPSERQTRYVSPLFTFVFGFELPKEGNYRAFVDTTSGKPVTSPKVALQFFLRDYDALVKNVQAKLIGEDAYRKATLVEARLYRLYPEVLTTNSWVDDRLLNVAIAKSNEWFWKQPDLRRALRLYAAKLRSFRNETANRFAPAERVTG